MNLRIFTLAFDDEANGFDTAALDEYMRNREVVSSQSSFFEHRGRPYLWVVTLSRSFSSPRSGKPVEQQRVDPRTRLAPDEKSLYDRLRAWRSERSKQEGLPPYVVLTNKQMAQVAIRRPASRSGLRDIEGIGSGKVEKYGAEILQIINKSTVPDDMQKPAGMEGNHE